MDVSSHREAFIPYRRADIIALCLKDGQLDGAEADAFQAFCEILTAFYHFQLHQHLETIKHAYAFYDPDAEVQPLFEPTLQEYESSGAQLIEAFQNILERANYCAMPEATIRQALDNRSLIALRTEVDFEDFEQFLCYYRGDIDTTLTVKKFFFWQKQQTIDTLERLVLLIKFKGDGYFRAKHNRTRQKGAELKFTPGKMYVYFYKNIPKLDLDLLFPNIRTSMTWRDRLLLMVPAIGAAVPVIVKTIPNILLLVAAVLLALNAQSALQAIDFDAEQARDVMPVLVATLTLAMALGGFAAKQYSQYKSKQIKFQKDVADTLFFKNLATNASVFQRLVDLAEEEECKEIILVYYHLLIHPQPLTPRELDAKIEAWMREKTGADINFDIHGPLRNLNQIRGATKPGGPDQPLLTYDNQHRCRVLPLAQAQVVLDCIWDNAFRYGGSQQVD